MSNKSKGKGIADGIILFMIGVGGALLAVGGLLIGLVIGHGGTDNLTVPMGFLLIGLVMFNLGVVWKILQRRGSKK